MNRSGDFPLCNDLKMKESIFISFHYGIFDPYPTLPEGQPNCSSLLLSKTTTLYGHGDNTNVSY